MVVFNIVKCTNTFYKLKHFICYKLYNCLRQYSLRYKQNIPENVVNVVGHLKNVFMPEIVG